MADITIPLNSDVPKYRLKTTLEDTEYTFVIRYNQRKDIWIMSLLDSNEDPIIYGQPILLGQLFFDYLVDERLPPGNLFAFNAENFSAEANRNTLGTEVLMIYRESV